MLETCRHHSTTRRQIRATSRWTGTHSQGLVHRVDGKARGTLRRTLSAHSLSATTNRTCPRLRSKSVPKRARKRIPLKISTKPYLFLPSTSRRSSHTTSSLERSVATSIPKTPPTPRTVLDSLSCRATTSTTTASNG